MKALIILAPLALLAGPAHAADSDVALNTELSDFSGQFGSRRISTAEYGNDLGDTSFSLALSQGRRRFDGSSASSVRVSGTLFHDWSDRVYTKTTASLSRDRPVFATRELATDVNLKVFSGAVLTVGGKLSRYFGNRDARSLSAGGAWYFGGGYVSYRYSGYDVDGLGRSHGHLATFRLKDGKGSGATQLWLGSGSSLQEEQAWLSDPKGRFRSASVQRIQPLAGPVSLRIGVGRSWYKTPVADYHGNMATLGISYSGSWRPKARPTAQR
jgi:YaiO family outer membrane protein